jgi:hypothetical protein
VVTGGVFINYRGVDVNYAPRLLYQGLVPRFGRRNVFFDEESIPPGEDYVRHLEDGVRSSAVLLAVIGPQWLTTDPAGRRRIDDPRDWIRRELVTAYESGVRVIPVFTEGARPEDLVDLPEDIARLRITQGMELGRRNAHEDIAKIAGEVAQFVPARRRRGVAIAVVLAALLLVGAGVGLSFLFRGEPGGNAQPSTSNSEATSGPTTTTSSDTSSEIETTTTTTPKPTTTTKPPEPEVLWSGTVNLDHEQFQTGVFLDWSPPERAPAGDLGLCSFDCGGAAVAGTAFAAWTGDGLPDRKECADLLSRNVGQRRLPVKVGTKACLGTENKRVGHLEVVRIDGPGKMRIEVKVWDLP